MRQTELLQAAWCDETLLLVMPGGADLPYCGALNGPGNARIRGARHTSDITCPLPRRLTPSTLSSLPPYHPKPSTPNPEFVMERGGAYLGLCAGAYYACRAVCFQQGRALEVLGERELRFFPGRAWGSVTPEFDYQSERGAMALGLCTGDAEAPQSSDVWRSHEHTASEWRTCDGKAPSGRRFCDYVHGGPCFVPDGAAPGVEVLARYAATGHIAAAKCACGRGVAVLCGSHPELHPDWLRSESTGLAGEEAAHVAGLVDALAADQDAREAFFRSLLVHAGLAAHLR